MESTKVSLDQAGLLSRVEGQSPAGAPQHRRPFSQNEKHRSEILGFCIDILCQQWPLNLKELLETLEKDIILNALSRVGGNQKEAARILGIKYTTLNEKIKRYNIHFQKNAIWPVI